MNHKEKLTQLIAKGKIKQAIAELLAAVHANNQTDLISPMLQLSARFHRNEEANLANIISHSDYGLEFAKINNTLNYYLDDYIAVENEKQDADNQSNSNNTINANGSGNIIIQDANNSHISINTSPKNKDA